jgi:hypothetical protein
MLQRVREPISHLPCSSTLPRHLHAEPYATVVLEGG